MMRHRIQIGRHNGDVIVRAAVPTTTSTAEINASGIVAGPRAVIGDVSRTRRRLGCGQDLV